MSRGSNDEVHTLEFELPGGTCVLSDELNVTTKRKWMYTKF